MVMMTRVDVPGRHWNSMIMSPVEMLGINRIGGETEANSSHRQRNELTGPRLVHFLPSVNLERLFSRE